VPLSAEASFTLVRLDYLKDFLEAVDKVGTFERHNRNIRKSVLLVPEENHAWNSASGTQALI